jgi:putative Mn2+ efflux pump MntP
MIKPFVPAFLGLSLAMDALTVSIAMVICTPFHLTAARVIRVSGTFGLFQALMPLLGWVVAGWALPMPNGAGQWIAFGLLAFVGGKMVLEGLKQKEECLFTGADPSRGLSLIFLAIGTSLDALVAGVGFVPLGLAPFFTSSVIGFLTFSIVAVGMSLANRIGRRAGAKGAVIGGLILIAIGVKILFSHGPG